MSRGLFIVLEGGEGSGKTTLAKNLADKFDQECILTREPGGVEVAEEIRNTIMDYELNPKTEALLFAAARCEHLNQKVIPALNNGVHVISDRYIDSSVVYQGFAKGLGMDKILDLNHWATDNMIPDISFCLDIDPQVGLERIAKNNRETNRFDANDLQFHLDLNTGYKKLFTNRENSYIIDATQSIEAITDQVYQIIMDYLHG